MPLCSAWSQSRVLTNHLTANRWPPITGHRPPLSKSLAHQLFHREPTFPRFSGHHLLYVLRNQVSFEIHRIAGLERVEVRHLHSMRNDGDGTRSALKLRDRETYAFDADGTLIDRVFLYLTCLLYTSRCV